MEREQLRETHWEWFFSTEDYASMQEETWAFRSTSLFRVGQMENLSLSLSFSLCSPSPSLPFSLSLSLSPFFSFSLKWTTLIPTPIQISSVNSTRTSLAIRRESDRRTCGRCVIKMNILENIRKANSHFHLSFSGGQIEWRSSGGGVIGSRGTGTLTSQQDRVAPAGRTDMELEL